jgi:hypothetical protein
VPKTPRLRDFSLPVAEAPIFPSVTHREFPRKKKYQETVTRHAEGTTFYSPMWSADRSKIQLAINLPEKSMSALACWRQLRRRWDANCRTLADSKAMYGRRR